MQESKGSVLNLMGLIPSFGGALWTLIFFVVALSIIVAIHEYGHYIVGRWSGIHAEVFSLGFGPILFSRVDQRGTRWQVAAIPLGGYVKFLGDSNAASGKDGDVILGMSAEEKRHTMHGAPLWARASTVAAGPVFNFLTAIVLFMGMMLATGIATDDPVVAAVKPVPFAGETLQVGDRILAIGGQETADLKAVFTVANGLTAAPSVPYLVKRDDSEVGFDGPFPLPPLADGVQPGTAAFEAGMQPGDVITAVDGKPIYAFEQLRDVVGASEGRALNLTIWRDGKSFDTTLTPTRRDLPNADGSFETRWLIGLTGTIGFEPQTRTPTPWELVKLSVWQAWYGVKSSISGLWHMATGAISSCNLRGPLGIAESAGDAASQGVMSFVGLIASLSVAVGLMNLFPVPILDGGHLVFHAFEAVTGKPPSDRALRFLMMIGLALLVSLMVYATTNDITCP
jgi:regulator of sigma E protease